MLTENAVRAAIANRQTTMGSCLESRTCLSIEQSDLDPDQAAGWKRQIHREANGVVPFAAIEVGLETFSELFAV